MEWGEEEEKEEADDDDDDNDGLAPDVEGFASCEATLDDEAGFSSASKA